MPIIVDRATGQRITPEPTQEQRNDMLFAVFQEFAKLHPDMIQDAVDDYNKTALRH